jgi:hypothetical protein
MGGSVSFPKSRCGPRRLRFRSLRTAVRSDRIGPGARCAVRGRIALRHISLICAVRCGRGPPRELGDGLCDKLPLRGGFEAVSRDGVVSCALHAGVVELPRSSDQRRIDDPADSGSATQWEADIRLTGRFRQDDVNSKGNFKPVHSTHSELQSQNGASILIPIWPAQITATEPNNSRPKPQDHPE